MAFTARFWCVCPDTSSPMLVQMPMTEPGPLTKPGEGVREVVRVYRRVHRTGEDQPVVLPQETCRHLRLGPAAPDMAAYIPAHAGDLDEDGRRLMVRNGHARSRQVTTVAGAVEVQAPPVNDKRTDAATGERMRFCSAILPP